MTRGRGFVAVVIGAVASLAGAAIPENQAVIEQDGRYVITVPTDPRKAPTRVSAPSGDEATPEPARTSQLPSETSKPREPQQVVRGVRMDPGLFGDTAGACEQPATRSGTPSEVFHAYIEGGAVTNRAALREFVQRTRKYGRYELTGRGCGDDTQATRERVAAARAALQAAGAGAHQIDAARRTGEASQADCAAGCGGQVAIRFTFDK